GEHAQPASVAQPGDDPQDRRGPGERRGDPGGRLAPALRAPLRAARRQLGDRRPAADRSEDAARPLPDGRPGDPAVGPGNDRPAPGGPHSRAGRVEGTNSRKGAVMLGESEAFGGFAVKDLAQAREFYGETLGLDVEEVDGGPGLLSLHLAGGRDVLVYAKPDFEPATYTVLNFPVDDIDAAVDGLSARGVEFERYEEMEQDEKRIARGPGPEIAGYKHPAGTTLSVLPGE